jgi:hypothetical protein
MVYIRFGLLMAAVALLVVGAASDASAWSCPPGQPDPCW